jgi:hypothetical protein
MATRKAGTDIDAPNHALGTLRLVLLGACVTNNRATEMVPLLSVTLGAMSKQTDGFVRLKGHPQAHTGIDYRTVWLFDCPRCKQPNYLRHARPLADGTLVCDLCFTKKDRHNLYRCAKCGGMFPGVAEFGAYPDSATECRACRAPKPKPVRARTCQHCGQMFTSKRSDARFCSGRCRVAAHRRRSP